MCYHQSDSGLYIPILRLFASDKVRCKAPYHAHILQKERRESVGGRRSYGPPRVHNLVPEVLLAGLGGVGAGERPGGGASAPSATTSRGVWTAGRTALPTPSTVGADGRLNARQYRAVYSLSIDLFLSTT